jgi:hypothetical protein
MWTNGILFYRYTKQEQKKPISGNELSDLCQTRQTPLPNQTKVLLKVLEQIKMFLMVGFDWYHKIRYN